MPHCGDPTKLGTVIVLSETVNLVLFWSTCDIGKLSYRMRKMAIFHLKMAAFKASFLWDHSSKGFHSSVLSKHTLGAFPIIILVWVYPLVSDILRRNGQNRIKTNFQKSHFFSSWLLGILGMLFNFWF